MPSSAVSAFAPLATVTHRTPLAPPAVPAPRIVRYRGGTYSSTIHRIAFADGTVARTDLVRLNPGIRAYSLDFDGRVAATPVTYRVGGDKHPRASRARFRWSSIASIVAASFPVVDLGTLSDRLRAAGYPLGAANLREDEAIAATQAAIWTLTNNLELDTKPHSLPSTVVARSGTDVVAALSTAAGGICLDAGLDAGRRLTIDVEFENRPVLASVSLDLTSSSPRDDLHVDVWKETATGWVRVPVTRSATSGGTQSLRLPPLATVMHSRHGVDHGHRRYRVTVTSARREATAVTVDGLRFTVSGQAPYANAANVVHLYEYLCGDVEPVPTHTAVILVADAASAHHAVLTPLVTAVRAPRTPTGDSLTMRPIPDLSSTAHVSGGVGAARDAERV